MEYKNWKEEFTWTIENFSKLNNRIHSEVFLIRGHPWRLTLDPHGEGKHVDDFRYFLDAEGAANLPNEWSIDAHYKLTVLNQVDNKKTKTTEFEYQFNPRKHLSGSIMPLAELRDPKSGFLVKDTCIIRAELYVREPGQVYQVNEVGRVKALVPKPEDQGFVEMECKKRREEFTWTVKNFSKLNNRRITSKAFLAGGHPWRFIMYPHGSYKVNYLSIFLDAMGAANLPNEWSIYAKFNLAVVNQDSNKTKIKECQHQFNVTDHKWGYACFIPLAKFCDPEGGFLVKDTCIIRAEVYVREPGHVEANVPKPEDQGRDLKTLSPISSKAGGSEERRKAVAGYSGGLGCWIWLLCLPWVIREEEEEEKEEERKKNVI